MTTDAYHLKNISHYYGTKKVLDVNDLTIPQGSITGLVGPNGSGKSTLLKLLGFALEPSEGDVFFRGKKEVCFSPAVRSRVTLLTQTPCLLKRTVYENIVYGLKIRKDTKDIRPRVEKALVDVGMKFSNFAERKWHELSGGEAQRVAMAARLILKPEVLLLDEPVASVDTKSARLIRNASMKAREKWGTTLVIASHDLQWLYSISDNHLAIFNGKIFSSGYENVIPGPYKKANGDILVKQTGNGESIYLKAPVEKSETAIISKKHLSIDGEHLNLPPDAAHGKINHLPGQITSMLLGKSSKGIMTEIRMGELSFILKLDQEQVENLKLYPGKKITLKFSSDDVEWI